MADAIIMAIALHCAHADQQDDRFFKALAQVEGWPNGSSDKGKAVGPFQIHKSYWLDACKQNSNLSGLGFNGCVYWGYSKDVVKAYFQRHAKKAWGARDWKTLARIHHCGPKAIKRGKGKAFAQRVVGLMQSEK